MNEQIKKIKEFIKNGYERPTLEHSAVPLFFVNDTTYDGLMKNTTLELHPDFGSDLFHANTARINGKYVDIIIERRK